MKANPRIALLADNPFRDLPGLVLTARQLCRFGATCFLTPMNLRGQELWPLKPDFVLLNHFRTVYERLARSLMDAGVIVGVLNTEGGVFSPVPPDANETIDADGSAAASLPAMEEYALSMIRDRPLRERIGCYCVWSPAFAAYAAKAGWYRADQMTVTGAPRMDFYAEQWRGAAKALSPYVDEYGSPLVLINGNFTLANPRFQSPQQEVEMMIEKFSYSRKFMDKWLRTQQAVMAGLAEVANSLAEALPEVTFIYRPHPFEGEDRYARLLKPLPNLHLVKKGTIDGWLLRAKAVVHWCSSTAIDAYLLGLPAFTAGWLPVHLPVPAAEAASINCASQNELKERIIHALAGKPDWPAGMAETMGQVIENTFYKVDGLAHRRMAEAIWEAAKAGPSTQPAAMEAPPEPKKTSPGLLTGLRRRLGRWRESRRQVRAWDRSDKRFDVEQVGRILQAIESCAQPEVDGASAAIAVAAASERGDYRTEYAHGRTVTMFPEQA